MRTLHKYTTAETTKIILKNSALRWSRPALYNDPFDMNFDPSFFPGYDVLRKEALEWIWNAVCSSSPVRNGNNLSKMINSMQGLGVPKREVEEWFGQTIDYCRAAVEMSLPLAYNEFSQFFSTQCRVLCLSATPDSIPMWGYYADGHRGVVLQFRRIDDKFSLVANAEPVNYLEAVPPVFDRKKLLEILIGEREFRFDPEDIVNTVLFSKSTAWAHEHEFRIVDFSAKKDGLEYKDIAFESSELEALIFGCKISKQDKEEIAETASNSYPGAKLYSAIPMRDSYALNLV